MTTQNKIHTASIIGMVSAGIWLIALSIEYQYQLFPPGDGSTLYSANQLMFGVAMAGYLIMLIGLWQSRAVGDSRFGKISLGIFIFAITGLLIGLFIGLTPIDLDSYLLPIGGVLQLIGCVFTGIAVITAKKWDGWQRFAPMLQGAYYLFLFILLAAFNQEPTQLTEGIWQATWFITSFALFTRSRNT